jgi:ankyrin repeat protein
MAKVHSSGYRGRIDVCGNEHFTGTKQMAVDVEDFEGFHEAIARKFKIDAFMLTCWDEDKERDTVLTDENLVKMLGIWDRKVQVRYSDDVQHDLDEKEARLEEERKQKRLAINRHKKCLVEVANGFTNNAYIIDEKAHLKRQRHVDEAIAQFRDIDDSILVPPARALWRLNPHYKYCSYWYCCVVVLRAALPCCCRGDLKTMASVNYIHRGQFEDVRRCINQGQDVNSKDRAGRTMLSIAVMQEAQDVTQLLLDAGADPNIPDDNTGLTPMHHAVAQENKRLLERLLGAKCDINTPDRQGTTAMMLASQRGAIELMQLIVAQAMFPDDPNQLAVEVVDVKDSQGWTPLHYAASGGQIESAVFLVEDAHINQHTKDKNGHTAAVVGERKDPKGGPGEVAAYLNSNNPHLKRLELAA